MAPRRTPISIVVAFVLLSASGEGISDFLWEDQHDERTGGVDASSAIAAEGDRVFAVGVVGEAPAPAFPQVSNPVTYFAVRAYDAWTGALLWEDSSRRFGCGHATAVAVRNARVFAGGTGGGICETVVFIVRAYDAITGAVLWDGSAGSTFAESSLVDLAASDDGVFAVGQIDGGFTVRAHDAATGALRWQDRGGFTNVSTAHAVAVDEDTVFAAGGSQVAGTTRAYDARTGALLWDATEDDYLPRAIAVRGGRVFTGGFVPLPNSENPGDFALRTYDRATGQLLWADRVYSSDLRSGQVRDLVTDGLHVYAVGRIRINDTSAFTGEFAVRAYDAETGRSLWMDIVGSPGTFEQASSVTLRDRQLMVAGTLDVLGTGFDFVVRTYDADAGELLWDDFVNGTANAGDGATGVAVLPNAVYVGGVLTNVGTSRDLAVRGYYK